MIRRALASLLTPMLLMSATLAAEPITFNLQPGSAFKSEDGVAVLSVPTTSAGKVLASVETASKLPAGWIKVDAEYKTQGLEPMGFFSVDMGSGSSQMVPASPSWAPMRFFVKQPAESAATFRVVVEGDMKYRSGAGSIKFRNFKFEPYGSNADKGELLADPSLSAGSIGWQPPLWNWQYKSAPEDFSLVEDKSFQSGDRAVRALSSEGRTLTLAGVKQPPPASDEIEFSVWARSEEGSPAFSLLLVGEGYKWFKVQEFQLSGAWSKCVLRIPLPKEGANSAFWPRVDVKGKGIARFTAPSLKFCQPETAQSKTQENTEWLRPQSRNLLANPDFELGWNGWMFDNFSPRTEAAALAQYNAVQPKILPKAGPDGSSAMELPAGNCLISGCFPIVDGSTYTLSAYVKAQKPGASLMMHCIDPGWKIYNKEFKDLSQDWTRISYTFKWDRPSVQKRAYVRLDASGVLLDKVQIEESAQPSEFSTAPLMAGFMAPSGWNMFVQGEELKPILLKVVPGKDAPSSFKASVVCTDAFGERIWSKDFDSAKSSGEFKLPIADAKFGVFNLEAAISGPDGKELDMARSRFAIVRRLPKPAASLPIFGTHHEVFHKTLWVNQWAAPRYSLMGAHLNRAFISYEIPMSETLLASLRRQAESSCQGPLIVCVDFSPEMMKEICNADTATPDFLARYSAWLKGIVEPLRGSIRNWEILNEPNIWRFGEGAKRGSASMPPEKYVLILKAAYTTIKAIDPSLTVYGACVNGSDFDYPARIMKLGAGSYMDAFSIHPYRTSPDIPAIYPDLMRFRKILDSASFKGPLVNTEQYFAHNSFMMHGSDGETPRGYYVPGKNELEACGRTTANFIQHAAAGVPYCALSTDLTQFRFGGYDGGLLHLLFGAYNAAAFFLEDSNGGIEVKMGDALRAFLFMKAKGGPILAFYSPVPNACGAVQFKSPCEGFDAMGNKLENGKALPVLVVPSYVRFPKEMSEKEILDAISKADISGMGEPFGLKMLLKDSSTLSVLVSNMRNKPCSGKVKLLALPKEWKLDSVELAFTDLKPGEPLSVDFKGSMPVESLKTCKVSILAESADAFSRKDQTISPLLAENMEGLRIDGDIEKWSRAKWLNMGDDFIGPNYTSGMERKGSADLSARSTFAWDKNGFTIAIDVTDNVADFPLNPAIAWQSDSIQLYFDQLSNAPKENSVYDADDISYCISLASGKPSAWLEKGPDGRYIGEANRATGMDADIQTAIKHDGSKTFYEIHIPAKCLPAVKFEKGASFGFSMMVNDNDGKGRKQSLTLAPKGTEPYQHPYFFRTMILR